MAKELIPLEGIF